MPVRVAEHRYDHAPNPNRGERLHPIGGWRAGPPAATVADMSQSMLAPEWRLKDLRAAEISNLPTRRRRNWSRAWSAGSALAVVWFAYVAASDRPLFACVAAILVVSTWGHIRGAREIDAQLRAPQTASYASFDEPGLWAQTGSDALGGGAGVVLSGSGSLADTGLGFATKLGERLWKRTKPHQYARWEAAIGTDLLPGEQRLVSCRALIVPHGWRRLVWALTLGLAGFWMFKRGFITVTDQRLLFHRRSWLRRPRQRLHMSSQLADVEVLEWYSGAYTESRYRVLIVRCADGCLTRFNIHSVWAKEAQWVFDVVASISDRPPAFLAARWISPA
jgi:hypothetical protein